jgi:hypothetical protein
LIARCHSTTAGEASSSGKADPLKKSSCGHEKIILPPLLGILSSLIVLELSVKDLDGNIPEELAKLNHFKSFLLNNSLSGAAENLTSLEQLNLAFNNLSAKFLSTGNQSGLHRNLVILGNPLLQRCRVASEPFPSPILKEQVSRECSNPIK